MTEKKEKFRIVIPRNFIILSIIAFVLFISLLFKERYLEYRKYSSIYKKVETENTALEKKIQEIHENIKELNTDDGVERIAREKLKLIKDGEHVIKIVEVKKEKP